MATTNKVKGWIGVLMPAPTRRLQAPREVVPRVLYAAVIDGFECQDSTEEILVGVEPALALYHIVLTH